jgi:hypothetical protein
MAKKQTVAKTITPARRAMQEFKREVNAVIKDMEEMAHGPLTAAAHQQYVHTCHLMAAEMKRFAASLDVDRTRLH